MAKITYADKVALNENPNVNAINKVRDVDMNELKEVINDNETKVLLAVSSSAPATCDTGDIYFNTTNNLIYTATATNTWSSTGIAPTENTIYIEFTSQTAYAYDGTTLVSVGGGSQGGGDSTPIGTVEAYSGNTAPNGYLLCDGSAVSRTTYSDLFSVIGTTYGSGDGSTTFNLPNLKGRTVVMQDTTQTEFDTLGETGGSKYLQEHKHIDVQLAGNHLTSWNSRTGSTGIFEISSLSQSNGTANQNYFLTGNVHEAQTGNSGNLQPYIVLNYIIKVQKLAGEVLSEQLPIGSEIDFDGSVSDIPIGWEQVDNVLWSNANPNSSFSAQTISLDLSQYDYVEIIYYTEVDASVWQYEMTTGKLPIINNKNVLLGGFIMITTADQAPQFFGRRAIIKTTGVEFATGKNYNGSSFSDRNVSGVPIYIIGYKA